MKSRFEHSTSEWNSLQLCIWHKLVDRGIVRWNDVDRLIQVAQYFSDVFEQEGRYATWEEIERYFKKECDYGRIE